MQNIQDVFNRIQGTKAERRDVQNQYKDAVSASAEYKDVTEKLLRLQIAQKTNRRPSEGWNWGRPIQKFEALKKDLELDKELLTDLAISGHC